MLTFNRFTGLLLLGASCALSSAYAAPAQPQIAHLPQEWQGYPAGAKVAVTVNKWWGEGATHWKLRLDGKVVQQGSFSKVGQEQQDVHTDFIMPGTAAQHTLLADFCNASGCTTSPPKVLKTLGQAGAATGAQTAQSPASNDQPKAQSTNTSAPAAAKTSSNPPGKMLKSGQAGASVHYYYYKTLGMQACPGRVAGYSTQAACDKLGSSQTENGPVNQVGLTCDNDPQGCIVGQKLMVTATDRCPAQARFVRVSYKGQSATVRIVDRTPGNGGFDLGLDPYIDIGLYRDYQIGVSGAQDIRYECLE